MTHIKENREFKIYNFSNGSRKQVEVIYTVMWNGAYRIFHLDHSTKMSLEIT